eukprot:4034629-Pleurochrysis_carterae.AAC.1
MDITALQVRYALTKQFKEINSVKHLVLARRAVRQFGALACASDQQRMHAHARAHARMHARTHTHTCIDMHTHAHSHAHMHHTDISHGDYFLSPSLSTDTRRIARTPFTALKLPTSTRVLISF